MTKGESTKEKAHESEEAAMTRFEKDYHEMLKGAGRYILKKRMEGTEERTAVLQEPFPVPVHLSDSQPAGTGIRSPRRTLLRHMVFFCRKIRGDRSCGILCCTARKGFFYWEVSVIGCTRKETETDSTQGAGRKSRPSTAQQERTAA